MTYTTETQPPLADGCLQPVGRRAIAVVTHVQFAEPRSEEFAGVPVDDPGLFLLLGERGAHPAEEACCVLKISPLYLAPRDLQAEECGPFR